MSARGGGSTEQAKRKSSHLFLEFPLTLLADDVRSSGCGVVKLGLKIIVAVTSPSDSAGHLEGGKGAPRK